MPAFRIRGVLSLAVLLLVAACGGSDTTSPPATPSAISIISGNGQSGFVGQTLTTPLTVKVSSSSGGALKGATVTFAVTSGAASISPSSSVTDSLGQAKTTVTLGATPGNVAITATVAGTALTASFTVTAGSSNTNTACSGSSPQTLALGAVMARVSGTGICLSGTSSGAEYALVAFYGDPDSSKVANLSVAGRGAIGVTTANLIPTSGSTLTFTQPRVNTMQAQYDAIRRNIARTELAPMVAGARAAYARRQFSAVQTAIPGNVTVGTLVTLNANSLNACTNIKNRVSRVAAVSNSAIVVADTTNPAGGFTDAEYASYAAMFDTLIAPMDIANFGTHTDIDGNGKVIIFFTKEVNALTPKGSSGFVGGSFFERDLFPQNADNTTLGLSKCAGSNFAEMFYMLVPDPTGIYSIVQSKADVADLTPGTLAHEYQHLINAARRLYINPTSNFPEDGWLNEGLSHIAEELLFYKTSGLAPRQNLTVTQLIPTNAQNAFFQYFGGNLERYLIFLSQPNHTSVYADNDSLETRGATWSLLRYLADQRSATGASEVDTWQKLVNNPLTGKANLATVFGNDFMTQIGNWAIALFADDVTGQSDPKFSEPSWNFRNILVRLADGNGRQIFPTYPLSVFALSDASPVNTTVFAGGAAYVRFSVAAGGQASIDWNSAGLPVSPLMQLSIVRTK